MNLCLSQWELRVLTTGLPGKSPTKCILEIISSGVVQRREREAFSLDWSEKTFIGEVNLNVYQRMGTGRKERGGALLVSRMA